MEDEGGELKAAHEFYKLLLKLNPGYKEPNFQKWAKDFDMMLGIKTAEQKKSGL